MTAENFCYWLRGFLEIGRPIGITYPQIEEINKHLDLVLTPVTKAVEKKSLTDYFTLYKIGEDGQSQYCGPNTFNPVISWPDGPPASC